eukprot:Partr_v1_DN26364_c0_g1_i2_m43357 putative Glioma tumor suppressor candidate region gene 2
MAKKQQPSRKGSKAWRKNIDIADIEEHLVEKVREEMAGGPISERADTDLFKIDKAGKPSGNHVKRQADKPLRIDQILAERSAVDPVQGRKRKLIKQELKPNGKPKGSISKEQKMLIKRKLAEMRDSGIASVVKHSAEPKSDLWDQAAVEEPTEDFISHLMPKPVKKPKSAQSVPKVQLHVPAVEVSHPGTSYNPRPEDHEEAVKIAANIELERMQTEADLKVVIGNKEAIIQKHNLSAEMTMNVDAVESDDDVEDEAPLSGDDAEGSVIFKQPRKKTQTDRNKEQRKKAAQMEQEAKKLSKLQRSKLNHLDEIIGELDDKLSAIDKKKADKIAAVEEKQNSIPARVSKHPYKPLYPTVQLSEDLPQSLREMKAEGNIFRDIYNSMEKRNKIETRVPVGKRRRYQPKEYEKHSYKKFK